MITLTLRLLGVASLAFVASHANAGEVLHLRQGDVQTRQVQDQFLSTTTVVNTNYFVVQFNDKISAQDRAYLAQMGASTIHYLPDDALIIKIPAKKTQQLQTLASVHAVVPFANDWKLSPELGPISVFNQGKVERVLVTLASADEMAFVSTKIQNEHKAQIVYSSNKVLMLELPLKGIYDIAAIDGVMWIQPYVQMQLQHMPLMMDDTPAPNGDFSDLTGTESGTKVMNFDAAWARGYDGRGQTAGMADTGLDTGDRATLWKDFPANLEEGEIFGIYSQSWNDPMGHGTHVAGSIYSNGAGSGGKIMGGAHGAHFVAQSMWSPMLENLSVPPDLSSMFDKAYAAGVRVHSNSWGSPRDLGSYDSFAKQVDDFMWNHPDMLILFAAGNEGIDKDKDGRVDEGSVGTPATAKNTLSVGASKNYVLKGGIQKHLKELKVGQEDWPAEPLASSMLSENARGLAPFSSRGPTKDGRLKPEVVAPGTNILSNCSHVQGADPLWGKYNDDYCWSGGTSMATPLTAGAATVVRQYLVDAKGLKDPSGAVVKNILMNTATDLYPGQFGEIGKDKGQELLVHRPDVNQGYGLVNMDAATALDHATIVDDQTGVATGEAKTVQVQATGKLVATLVYTDAPAAEDASKALVNDLDLEVTGPNGQIVAPHDRVNNSEIVEIPNASGAYTITVKGFNVPQGKNGKQPYSLVVNATQTSADDRSGDKGGDGVGNGDNGSDNGSNNGNDSRPKKHRRRHHRGDNE